MIQPAAKSVASSLVLGPGAQAASDEDPKDRGDFAALLGSTVATGQDGIEGARDPASADKLRQATGKPAGSTLPPGAPDLATEPASDGSDKEDAIGETDLVLQATTTAIILPGLVIPVSVQPTQAPAEPAQTLPQIPAPPASQSKPTVERLIQTAAAQAAKQPDGTKAGPAAASPGQLAVTVAADQGQTDEPASTSTATVTARFALPERPASAAESTAAPKAAADQLAERAAAPKAQAAAAVAGTAQAATAPTKAEPAATPLQRDSAMREAVPVETPAPEKSATKDIPAPQARPAMASAPQQSLAIPDPQPLAQGGFAVTTASFASQAPTGHDFAALVDRLVDARQSAAPEAVQAAISHREFGQVSLRFNQDASGLSVAMSSADPEFARAVQATAASAQSQTASDNGSTAPRQDGSGQQQQHATGQAQSQSQSQSQASARNVRNPQTQAEGHAGQERQDDDPARTSGGIYA